jgi:hypothetical protein
MKDARKCLACKVEFVTDYRNGHPQAYCPEDNCQRARRRQEQLRRRAFAKSHQVLAEALEGSTRLQRASEAREAFLSSQSPVTIGLISTLIDTLSRDDIEKTIWRLWQCGQSILGRANSAAPGKRPNTKQEPRRAP